MESMLRELGAGELALEGREDMVGSFADGAVPRNGESI
jgi:hypothetical protein